MNVLVTGSSGLIGSEAVLFYDRQGHSVTGIDNNMRAEFFGPDGDTTWMLNHLRTQTQRFTHYAIDIRDRDRLFPLFQEKPFELIVHCAAQPSHDKARDIPLVDFEVNAMGTINLLEATRQFCPEAVFIHMSTNKVYGDRPNQIPLVEQATRFEYANKADYHGINENCSIDQCLHSLFGASKASSDLVAQEYGRYFGLKTGIFRGGCLTGPSHSGVALHGFLNYLVKAALQKIPYTIFGYKGKQVRDNIHSRDVIFAIEEFRKNPRPAEVYNLGGGRNNSISILEAIDIINSLTKNKFTTHYEEEARVGDHICYISDLRKFQSHYPAWAITRSVEEIITELIESISK